MIRSLTAGAVLITIAFTVAVAWVPAKWPTTIPEVSFCTIAAFWALLFATGKAQPRYSVVLAPLAGVVIWGGVELLSGSTVYSWQTWMSMLYWTGNLAVCFIGVQIFEDVEFRSRFLRILLAFGFVVCVISTLQGLTTNAKVFWMFQTDYRGWLVFGPFVYHNQYAAFIEILLPIALFGALTDQKWRLLYLLVAATMYASVIAAASRTGSLLATAELIAVPAVVIRRRQIPFRIAIGAAGALVGMVLLLTVSAGPGLLLSRFGLADPVRKEFLYSSAEMFRDRPLLGVGLGNWSTAYPGYARFDDGKFANQAHNDWIQWAVEGGIPLLALMIWLAVWVFPRALRTGWGAGAAAVFLHCLVDYPIQRTAVASLFFAVIAAIACASEGSKESAPSAASLSGLASAG